MCHGEISLGVENDNEQRIRDGRILHARDVALYSVELFSPADFSRVGCGRRLRRVELLMLSRVVLP